ncbi:hypothetical protein BLJAPNOD_02928 [Ensifer sp. M14]|uniref:hypothetical protein n=1 Tax=Ensifer sp. M14 TaxID=2203782 RepID=UPI000E1D0FC9|nr:hypothetical protein [Ensifer sp. M14]RDL51787.1 hypothetical protein BLJAPNOD_02928 [Ensifer sp. M14]
MDAIIAAIGPFVPVIVLILTIWWKVEGKISAQGDKAEKAITDLATYKTHVAETFATKAGMQEQTGQIMRAIESVGNRIDGVHERLDRAFEQRTSSRATRS